MTETDKKLAEQVAEMTECGMRRGRSWTVARKCFRIGFRAGKRQQEAKDHGAARWEIYAEKGNDVVYMCGRCHQITWEKTDYCPCCGAKMRKEYEHGCQPGGAE